MQQNKIATTETRPALIDEDLLEKITRRIVEAVHPNRIVLFGSRARGDHNQDSDIDLFIEMESNEPRWLRRKQIDQLFPERWWPMDLYILTPEESQEWGDSLATILPSIKREGTVLYERPNA
jgi:predicted nucleotidyltransferase